MPNPQEKEAARKNLERFDWSVDYVLTHDCSEKMKVFLSMGQQNNSLNRFLTEIEGKLQFRKWFFGFYHLDRQIPPRHCAVYRSVQRLDWVLPPNLRDSFPNWWMNDPNFFTFCTNRVFKAQGKIVFFPCAFLIPFSPFSKYVFFTNNQNIHPDHSMLFIQITRPVPPFPTILSFSLLQDILNPRRST